ncbi:hypothetical protein PC120_g23923 [Phytophthora cactorum]|nr:hypothetical protein PC120_g23923 [Phytophthora cactorum]
MVKSFAPFATTVALLVVAATATSVPDGSWPASTGTVQYSEAYIIKAGEVFDGKMQTFERSDVSCEGQTESGADTAVFKMEPGATLKNAIIGKNQMEGVHCDKHDCVIENVWWDDVCEDALSIKGGTASSVSKIIGGGARYADDKVIQHNGYGTVEIDGFYGEDISKLYRSCGTCGDRPKKVSVSNSYIVNPGNAIVTVNKNWGDEATLKNVWVKSSKASVKICQWSQGNANGEPKMLGNGPSPPLCQYSESDVHINKDVSQAAQTSPSSTSSSSDVTQTASSASTASSDVTQTASSASTDSSVASSASTASSSSQNPTQASSASTTSSASASYQASSNSSTDASEADAPGTVAPVENGSFEQSVVSSDASQTQQQDATEEPTATPSVSSSGSGSLYSSSDDVSQTAVQQSSVASSGANGSTTSSSSPTSGLSSDDGPTTQSSSNGSVNQSPGSDSITQSSGSDSVTQNTGSGSATQTATNSTGTVPDGSWPASTGTVQYSEAYIIKAGEVFDGKMQTFERSDVSCEGQTESGADTAVFKMEPGATLKNAIIGKNQMEGVHCDKHDCVIENVWWDDVCEDALSIKGGTASSVSKIIGGGARYADDKVIQHNGYGTVEIDGFYGEDISKLYRSCGTCGDRPKKVSVSNSYIVNPGNAIVTVNKNWGDEATLKNVWVKSSKASVKICQWSQGNANGEPKMLGNGPSPPLCQYSESDVHINEK